MDGQNILKGALAGAVGGLVASFAMNQFRKAWSAAEEKLADGQHKQQNSQKNGEDSEDATMKTADASLRRCRAPT